MHLNSLFITVIVCVYFITHTHSGLIPIEPTHPYTQSKLGPIAQSSQIYSFQHTLLLLFPSTSDADDYTLFLDKLKSKGYTYQIESFRKKEFTNLIIDDQPTFGGVILFDIKGIKSHTFIKDLLAYIDVGGNLMVLMGGQTIGNISKNLIKQFEISMKSAHLIEMYDKYTHPKKFNISTHVESPILTYNYKLLYEGFGMNSEPNNPLYLDILTAPPKTICFNEDNTKYNGCGGKTSLVSALITRNESRIVLSGSSKIISNEFITENPGNANWFSQLIDWNLKNKGVISTSNLKHYKVDDPLSNDQYKWNDEIYFSVDVHYLKNDYWYPFESSNLQLEAVMYHPYFRINLDPPNNSSSPTFSTKFIAPDKAGIFKLVLTHQAYGLNPIYIETKAPIRVYRTDEYKRFVISAYPYYGSAICSLLGTLVFTLLFIYHKDQKYKTE